nr:hypothetical protein [Mycobacterium sp. UM_NZ2]
MSSWDGVSDFFEEDASLEKIRAITDRPPYAVTGEEYDPANVPGDQRRGTPARDPAGSGAGRGVGVPSYLPRVGIARFTTRIRLSSRIGGEDDGAALVGIRLWIVDYTVTERGKESSYAAPHVAEASARRMVANLLNDRLPGLTEEDVYSEELG